MVDKRELVILSLIWSLVTEMLKEYNGKGHHSLKEIQRISMNSFKSLSLEDQDEIEELKIKVWINLAELYPNEVVVSLPQVVEVLAWAVTPYMQHIDPQFERWVNSMSMKVSHGKSSIKLSNEVADRFEEVLNASISNKS